MIAKSARHLDLHPAGGKLLAKPRDQHLDGGLVDRGADTIDMVDQLGFRDQPAIPLDKAFQRGEFLARKFKIDAVMRGETKGRIDGQPPKRISSSAGLPLRRNNARTRASNSSISNGLTR